jgi:polysaccharide deacetylase family protein (PEP-CTERM system associated)
MAQRLKHYFTVDVEEYFHVSAFEGLVDRGKWGSYEQRLDRGMSVLTDLLDEFGVRATFFVLGWVAERNPTLVKHWSAAGHEIASHGTDHKRVTSQTPSEFRASVRDSKRLLEDLTGRPVHGFRAPSFSIVPGTEWALDVLIEEGYRYDSSLFPIGRKGYGYPDAPPVAHTINRPVGTIQEFPPCTMTLGSWRVPASGGGYLRLLPFYLTRAGFRRAEQSGQRGVFYIHPWELDPAQPRLPAGIRTKIRHYHGIGQVPDKIRTLLQEFDFEPIVPPVHIPAPAGAT